MINNTHTHTDIYIYIYIYIYRERERERERERCIGFQFRVSYSLLNFLVSLFSAIDLVDEAAAKLKMEITSKPTELDEVDRAVLKLEMEKLSLQKDTDKSSKERLSKLESDLSSLKQNQMKLSKHWEHEKSLMTRIRSIKEEVRLQKFDSLFFYPNYSLTQIQCSLDRPGQP